MLNWNINYIVYRLIVLVGLGSENCFDNLVKKNKGLKVGLDFHDA